MWETLRNAWRVPELRKKILYTFLMLLLYRLVGVIIAPGIDYNAVKSAAQGSMAALPIFEMMNMLTGSQLSQMTLMAMGITPYINASIIMQLLTIAIPALERLSKEGKEGQDKINRISRYVTIGLAVVQAIGIAAGLRVIKPGWYNYALVGLSMAGGTALAMWIGERITEKGIGNGISLLIFAGIISNLFNGYVRMFGGAFTATTITPWVNLLGTVVATLLIITVVTFVELGERRIPVQYAKRVVGRKMYGGQSTHIPMKVNSTGVLPLIFAQSFLMFIPTIIQLVARGSAADVWIQANMTSTGWLYNVLVFLLIIAFTYFYKSISFNPQDISKNIQQQGGLIPGIRSGKATVDHLSRISNRLTLFGALFLGILATVPTFLLQLGLQIPFAASSMLIAVSVALETTREVESQLITRNYKGFL
ncbi:MAG: preprotein translocase subunit SecY [Clostridiales bacterium]|nr:preprotein translocase subunit SecY [Clostridiales bacterium]